MAAGLDPTAIGVIHGFVRFARGRVPSDSRSASGVEIGRPDDTYRRVGIESRFGRLARRVVTDGRLPYPMAASLPAMR
jgi:hypothetical protein